MKKITAIIMWIFLALSILFVIAFYPILNSDFQIADWAENLLAYTFFFVFPAIVGVAAGWNVKSRGGVIFVAPIMDTLMQLIVFHAMYAPFIGIIMFTMSAVPLSITALTLYFVRKKRRINE